MSRSIVIIPENFSGPWSAQFSCPMNVYAPGGVRKLAVLVTDPSATIPSEGVVHTLGPLDTLNAVLTRAGFSRTPPQPPPAPVIVLPPPEVIPEPVVIPPPVVVPESIILPPEPPPLVEPSSFFGRVKRFFRIIG